MRSRPDLSVLISPPVLHPGQSLDVEAVLASRSETPVEQIAFRLIGREAAVVGYGRNRREWSHLHVGLAARHPAAVLTPGRHSYRARFDLPPAVPPSYAGGDAHVRYELEVRVDIPWWPDRVGRYDIPVAAAPNPEAATAAPRVFASSGRGPRGKDLYAELSVDSAFVAPGDVINGTLSLANTQHHGRVRRVEAAFVGLERIRTPAEFLVPATDNAREVFRYAFTLHEGAVPEGQALPFRARLPAGMPASFEGVFASLAWVLEVRCDSGWSKQVVLRAPITVVHGASRRAPREGVPAVLPAVGNERRAQVWAGVAQRYGLAYDPATEVMRGSAGAVAVSVLVEQRGDEGLFTVARLAWPSLGLDLDVGPAGWTDRLSREEIDVGDAIFDARYRVRGRLPAQVRALLEADVRTGLDPFPEVALRDEGAVFAIAGAAVLENLLDPFVGATMLAARTFAAAFARIPPPPALAPHAGAWRSYAAVLNARFEPGRGFLHDGAYGMERVSLGCEWSAAGAFERTVVRMTLDPPLPEALFDANGEVVLPRAAAALHAELAAEPGARVVVTRDAVGLELAGAEPLADPARLDPLLDKLARLSRALRGREDAGPFR